jgi:galactokinase
MVQESVEPDDEARAKQLRARFRSHFGGEPDFVARAPGRINLIGEHTDYNGGFVLPAAINRTIQVAARAVRNSSIVEMVSVDYEGRTSFDLRDISPENDEALAWSNYVRAVAWALNQKGLLDLQKLPGAQMVIEGNVPRGSGLSSSAAIEVASALCFTRFAGVDVDRPALALACQTAENEFIGVKSGIMDQFISALGQPDSALLIDTRSLDYRPVPLGLDDLGCKLVAVDSAAPRTLASTAYNQRRAECEEAVGLLAPRLGLGPNAQLRDITSAQLEANAGVLPEILLKRARHVIRENERTLQAVGLMDEGLGQGDNLQRFGELLYASHRSLRDDYEVSSAQLDLLVDLASKCEGVIGARMTGAGFGGCTVNIVQADHLDNFAREVVEEYRRRSGLDAELHVCRAVEGGSFVWEAAS